MTVEEAIALVEQLLVRGRLTKVQEIVLRCSWDGKTYLEMAQEVKYDTGYIKDVGSELWRSLSQALGEKVTKNNLHGVLKRTAHPQKDTNLSSNLNVQPLTNSTNWGKAIDVSQFYGRTIELETLSQLILCDHCRWVKLAEQLQGEFEYVIWRSLQHALFFDDKVTDCIKILSRQQVNKLSTDPHEIEGDGLPVHTLALSGLEVAAEQTILTLKDLLGSEDDTRQLVVYRINFEG